MGSSPVDLFADIDVGAGNDTALVEFPHDPSEIPGTVRELNLSLVAGAGDARSRSGPAVSLMCSQALTWARATTTRVKLNRDSPPVEDLTSIVHVNIDAGSGTDGVVCDVQTLKLEDILVSLSILSVDILSVDTLFPMGLLRLRGTARQRRANPTKVALTQVGSDLAIDLTTGADDDLIQLETDPAADGSVPASLADTGGGNDSVTVTGSIFVDLVANIDLGAGNDTALVEYPHDPEDLNQPVGLHLNLAAGTGDDAVTVRGSSFFDVHANIDLRGRRSVRFDRSQRGGRPQLPGIEPDRGCRRRHGDC